MTSKAPQGYSHHPHIKKEWNNSEKQKGKQGEEKQKIVEVYTKNRTDPNPKP